MALLHWSVSALANSSPLNHPNSALCTKNNTEKILEQSQLKVEKDQTKHKIGLGKPRNIALYQI